MSAARDQLIASAVAGKPVTKKGYVRCACPLCELREGSPDRKRSFGLNVSSLWYECYRCGVVGRMDTRPEDFEGLELEDRPEVEGIDGPPDGFLYLDEEPAYSSRCFAPAWDYLLGDTPLGRGLTEEQVSRAAIGVCTWGKFQGRVVVPVFDTEGKWAWYVGRAWTKKAEKPYLYPSGGRRGILYNHGAILVETDAPVLMVEGAFDAIPYRAADGADDVDACAYLGKPTEFHLLALEDAKRPIVHVLDGDAHAEAWAITMRLRLAGKQAGTVRLPPRIDPDEVDRERLLDCAWRSLSESDGEVRL